MNGRMKTDLTWERRINNRLSGLPQYVSDWNLHMKASEKAPLTRWNYITHVKELLELKGGDVKNIPAEDITMTDVEKFCVSRQTKIVDGNEVETTDSFRCLTWSALNNFFKYMLKRKMVSENFMASIDRPKDRSADRINEHRILLTEDDFQAIYNAVDEDKSLEEYCCFAFQLKQRNKLILRLLMVTGMRKTALSEINFDNIYPNELIIVDKRKKRHVYPLDEQTMKMIRFWIMCRKQLLGETEAEEPDAFFINMYGQRLSTGSIANIVRKYSLLGLGYEISPHKIRSGCASILYNKTHDIEFVKKSIGHSDVTTTERYIVTKGKEREESNKLITGILD